MEVAGVPNGEFNNLVGYSIETGGNINGGLNTSVPADDTYSKALFEELDIDNRTRSGGTTSRRKTPYQVNIQMEMNGRTKLYQQGEFLFSLFSEEYRYDHVVKARSLWDLNYSQMRNHARWKEVLRGAASPRHARLLHDKAFKDEMRPSFSTDFIDEKDLFCELEGAQLYSLNKFLNCVTFIGITEDPSTNHIADSEAYEATSQLRTFVCNAEGYVRVPNIFRAVTAGDVVGFVYKKFVDPCCLDNLANMTFSQILETTGPAYVWPMCIPNGTYPTCGQYAGDRTYRGTFANIMPLFEDETASRLGLTDQPDAAHEFQWDELDPRKISLRYADIQAIQELHGMEESLLVRRVFMTGFFLPLGIVVNNNISTPDVECISEACLPTDTRPTINSRWTMTMSRFSVDLHTTHPDLNIFRHRHGDQHT